MLYSWSGFISSSMPGHRHSTGKNKWKYENIFKANNACSLHVIIPALRNLRQEDYKFKKSLCWGEVLYFIYDCLYFCYHSFL